MAAAYLEGVVDAWFQNWSWERVEWSWPQFVNALCTQFGERPKTNVVIGVPKAAHQVVQRADEVVVEKEDGVHAADAKYETELLQEEILAESVPMVYSSNQQVGGWGNPPAEEYDSLLDGDVFGILLQDQPNYENEPVNKTKQWGDPEVEEEEEEERIVSDNLLGTSHTNVIGMGTQDKTKVTLQPEELGVLYRFLSIERFAIISMIGKDMVAAITDQLEPFSMEIRMRGMAGLAVAASHSTNVFEENDTKRQKEKKTRDKHKKRRRRNQIARAGIG